MLFCSPFSIQRSVINYAEDRSKCGDRVGREHIYFTVAIGQLATIELAVVSNHHRLLEVVTI
jgi:hypothetical protein